MTSPTFTVITAVRNSLDDLQRTCLSLKQQTLQDFEWIVIDGASTDGTPSWLANFEGFRNRFHWVSESDKGIADAWNKGLDRARGDQVLILNAGDIYDPETIARFAQEVQADKITCCHARLLSKDGLLIGAFKAKPERLWRGMHLPHNWCSVPRAIYAQHGKYRLMSDAMDFDWFHRYYRQRGVEGFQVIDEILGAYHLGGHSDQNFHRGFAANAKILEENGLSRPLALIIRIVYTVKHRLRRLR